MTEPSDPLMPPSEPVPAGGAAAAPTPPPPAGHTLALEWMRANPVAAAVFGTMVATVALFYCAVPLFFVPKPARALTAFQWIWSAWNPETHYEHGPMVPFIILFLVWTALPKLRGVAPRSNAWGLVPLVFGVLMYLLAARALQPRFAWAGLPFMLFGGVLYAAGWRWTRVLLFPILCVFFLIPVPGIDQATNNLQVMATKLATFVCNVIGIKMQAVGTAMVARDESFQFQVIGDCSGINSLMAITLMTAVFAHLTQDRLWKKFVLFGMSIPVAIVGNIARLTSIMIVAKAFGQSIAGGWWHEISAYVVSFPFAFASLCLIHKALNWKRPSGGTPSGGERRRRSDSGPATLTPAPAAPVRPSYDY